MKKKNNNKGFSLIELIIAIAILVILTGLLAPQFMKYIEKSREAKDIQAMDTVYSSIQAALANEGAYDAMVEATYDTVNKKSTLYKNTLEDAIAENTSFGAEVKGLLGKENLSLKSKKATLDGEICVAIEYVEGKETIEVPTADDPPKTEKKEVETFGGFSIMVYCGDDGAQQIEGLQSIGDVIDLEQ